MKFATTYSNTLKRFPMIASPAAWMVRNGGDPIELVNNALLYMESRKRFMPPPNRDAYAAKVILGAFFVMWLKKHQGKKTIAQLQGNSRLKLKELEPFLHAIIASSNERAFERICPRMARLSMIKKAGLSIGTPDDFEAYVTDHANMLGELMLSNFDTSRPKAAYGAVTYIQVTAVSNYLIRRTRPIRTDAPNLRTYLNYSRLSTRSKLAVKLAYLPSMLKPFEKDILTEKYGFEGSFILLKPIKDIAELLEYKNPAALSRKLYRVRAWCCSSGRGRKGGHNV